MNKSNYSGLNRAQLTFDYLHTNSTTHEFLFGALAELVDNARDAEAETLHIYTVQDSRLRGNCMLYFLDDGCGMDPEETVNVISFGKSNKKALDSNLIGQYGNGLKSGSMRVGNDFILFTKKNGTLTCLFLSRTFHEREQIEEVIVPIPSFDLSTRQPLISDQREIEKHLLEMELILKYSPFHSENEFMAQFERIQGESGTLVILYNLKLLDNGKPELDLTSDPYDIILTCPEDDHESHDALQLEKRSFRNYVSILYFDPRMKVYIQGKKVRTKRLVNMLYKPRMYKYSSNRFRTRSEQDLQKALEESKVAEAKAREAESSAIDLEQRLNKLGRFKTSERVELRKLQMTSAELREICKQKKRLVERKQKALNEPKILQFIFGMNLNNRKQDGVFVYNCSRLIRMYERVGPQMDGGIMCSGVVGVVDVPYLVLEPTHNKQDFADNKEYRHLLKALSEHMIQYWKDMGLDKSNPNTFWNDFGYISSSWQDPPSNDLKYVKRRMMTIGVCLQCDRCLKWRVLPFSSKDVGKEFPDTWVCKMNSDLSQNRCDLPEKLPPIEESVLQKPTKTKEDQQAAIETKIKKLQKEQEKLASKVSSAREAEEMIEKNRSSIASTKPTRNSSRNHELRSYEEYTLSEPRRQIKKSRLSGLHQKYEYAKRVNSSAVDGKLRHSTDNQRKKHEHKKDKSEDSPEEFPDVDTETDNDDCIKEASNVISNDIVDESFALKVDCIETDMLSVKNIDYIPVDEIEPSAKKSKPNDRFSPTIAKVEADSSAVSVDRPMNGALTSTGKYGERLVVGCQLRVKLDGMMESACITSINYDTEEVCVKFDRFQSSHFDRWIRVKDKGEAWDFPECVANDEATDKAFKSVAKKLKVCLAYMVPPEYHMSKKEVGKLTDSELVDFAIDDFMKAYEKSLRDLISRYQTQAMKSETELETLRKKVIDLLQRIETNLPSDIERNPIALEATLTNLAQKFELKPSFQ